MSGKHVAKDQPQSFIFSSENLKTKDIILKKYPEVKKKKCCDAFVKFSTKAK